MRRIVYAATKEDFFGDLMGNTFVEKMCAGAHREGVGFSYSEERSWENNAPKIQNLLMEAKLPDDVYVTFEYRLPMCNKRIDCMLYGMDDTGHRNAVHIELKQWSNDSVEEAYDTGVFQVSALVGGGYRLVPHPSQQVATYQRHLTNYVEVFEGNTCRLQGVAYCYNYKSDRTPCALYDAHYDDLLSRFHLYSGDQHAALAAKLREWIGKGKGREIFEKVSTSPIRPTAQLVDAAADILRGHSEFSLLDDQLVAQQTILGVIEEKLEKPDSKTVVLIKGGPGTGKSVVALHTLAKLVMTRKYPHCYFTTRSKALRETLKAKLHDVALESAKDHDASDLITNIYSYKPHHYKEGEIDVLLVDEAHRISDSSNFMSDKFEEETYLSQVMSLIYCSKVAVFFIDDRQGVKNSEIGTSEAIKAAARSYHERLASERDLFLKKIAGFKKKCAKKESELAAFSVGLDRGDAGAMKRLTKLKDAAAECRRDVRREQYLFDVNSTFQGKVQVIELELKSQFRCNGSDNYLDWVDSTIFATGEGQGSVHFDPSEYEFGIFDSPQALYEKIVSLDHYPEQRARVAAGYCWRWSTELEPNGDLKKDVVIGDWKMPWETNTVRARKEFRKKYASSADTWAYEKEGINQIGCVFSIQGLEIDYIGVIIGPDLTYDPIHKCLKAVPGKNVDVKTKGKAYDTHIKNIYRVLMTRGKKGCFVYASDPKVAEYLKSRL